jgi:hypothetical protein
MPRGANYGYRRGLKARGARAGLSEDWVIAPVCGNGKVPGFVALGLLVYSEALL